jgi:hypothetical protein
MLVALPIAALLPLLVDVVAQSMTTQTSGRKVGLHSKKVVDTDGVGVGVASDVGGVACPSLLSPQQAIVPSVFTPHE